MPKQLLRISATAIMGLVLVCSGALGQSREQGLRLAKEATALLHKARSVDDLKKALEKREQALRIFQRVNARKDEAIALSNIGLIYSDLGQYRKALEYYERSLEVARRVKDVKIEGTTLNNMAVVYSSMGRNSEARDYYEKALAMAKRVGDRKGEGARLGNIGYEYYKLGQYSRAIEYHEKSLAIIKAVGDPRGEPPVLANIGYVYWRLGQYPKALEYLEKSLAVSRKVGDVRREGQALGGIGYVYASWNQYSKALEYSERSLEIARRIGDARFESVGLNGMAGVYSDWGKYDKALECYEKSLDICKRIGEARYEGRTLNEIGIVYGRLGKYASSLDYQEKSLEIAKRIGNVEGEGTCLNSIGAIYATWGQYTKALEYLKASLEIRKSIGHVQGEGVNFASMASVYRNLGQYPEALERYRQAIEIAKKIGDAKNEALALVEIGSTQAQLGEYHKALESYQEALGVQKKIGVPVKDTQKAMGALYIEMGKPDLAEPIIKEAEKPGVLGLLCLTKKEYADAKKYYKKSLALAEKSKDVSELFGAYTGLGKACEGLEDYKAAERYYEKGMKLTEEIRSGLMPAERKSFFEVKMEGFARSEPAQGVTRVRMKLNQAADSIDSSEVTRARTFSDNIAQKSEGGYAGVPKEIIQKEDELASKVAALRKQMASVPKEVSPDRYENINKQVQKAEADLKSFVEMLWLKYQAYASVKHPRPVALKEAAILPEEHILIFDVVSEGVGVKLIKGKEIAQTFYVKWKLADLENEVKRFRLPLEQLKLRQFDPKLGQELYKKLLGSVLMHVPEGTPLVIIPDGILALLPFEALVTGGKPIWKPGKYGEYPEGLTYLGDVYPISYYQSITAMTLVRTLGKREKTGAKLLAMVDPVFSLDDDRVKKVSKEKRQALMDKLTGERLMSAKTQLSGLEFLRLPLTAQLGGSLKKADPEKTDLFEGFEARKSVLLQKDLTPYRSIVFATHGYFGTDLPGIQEPVLILTLLDQPKGQDGFLRLTEVMSLKMNCDIVALTACQSGLGKQISGEGTMGMGRAFQYAGARSVLMSLWTVAESSSVQLVENFFKHMKVGKNKLEALKLAREEIRKNGYDHPFFWAPFILVGEVN